MYENPRTVVLPLVIVRISLSRLWTDDPQLIENAPIRAAFGNKRFRFERICRFFSWCRTRKLLEEMTSWSILFIVFLTTHNKTELGTYHTYPQILRVVFDLQARTIMLFLGSIPSTKWAWKSITMIDLLNATSFTNNRIRHLKASIFSEKVNNYWHRYFIVLSIGLKPLSPWPMTPPYWNDLKITADCPTQVCWKLTSRAYPKLAWFNKDPDNYESKG